MTRICDDCERPYDCATDRCPHCGNVLPEAEPQFIKQQFQPPKINEEAERLHASYEEDMARRRELERELRGE